MRRRLVALTVLPVLLFGTAACGEEGDPGSDSTASVDMGTPIEGVEVTGDFGKEAEVTVDAPLEVSESESQVLEAGDGSVVKEGEAEEVLLHFTVANGTTGKSVGSTYEQGVPLQAAVAEGQLFPSMLDAIVGKPSGTRLLITSTPEQAYGPQGLPDLDLGGEDPVVFVVDIMSTHPEEVIDAPDGEPVPDLAQDLPSVETDGDKVTGITFENAPKDPPTELQVIPLIEGDGPPARDDSFVTFDYYGVTWGGKEPFDQSYDREPTPFPLGIGGLIKAWDEGLVDVKRGSRVMIIAPPELAYGETAREGIPANSTLVFVVDILGVD